MRVKWLHSANKGRQDVAGYIRMKFGEERKNIFLQHVRQTTQRLKQYPDIGRVDPMFVDLSRSYRSIVIDGLSKLVYFVEDDVIYIAAFWDTRRLPSMMADIENR